MNSLPIVVVIPAYNEERYIGSVLLKLRRYPAILIVVDDGSTDDTAGIAQAADACVIRHPTNRGKGAALATGLTHACRFNPRAVVFIDADGQHLPEQLPLLIAPILSGEADLVVGSRYLGPCERLPLLRRLAHAFLNRLIALGSGLCLTDSQSGYRALSPRACAQALFQCDGFVVESEMQFLAIRCGLRVREVPITIRYPRPTRHTPWRQGFAVLIGILRLTAQHHPVPFLTVPAIAFLAILACLTNLFVASASFIFHILRGLLIDHSHFPLKGHPGD